METYDDQFIWHELCYKCSQLLSTSHEDIALQQHLTMYDNVRETTSRLLPSLTSFIKERTCFTVCVDICDWPFIVKLMKRDTQILSLFDSQTIFDDVRSISRLWQQMTVDGVMQFNCDRYVKYLRLLSGVAAAIGDYETEALASQWIAEASASCSARRRGGKRIHWERTGSFIRHEPVYFADQVEPGHLDEFKRTIRPGFQFKCHKKVWRD